MYSRLNMIVFLTDLYDPDMPARPAVREVYGNCFPKMGHKVTWIMPAKARITEIQEENFGGTRILVIPYRTTSLLPRKVFNKLLLLWREQRVASKVIREERCNIIQVRNGILEGLLGAYLKRRHKVPFVFQYSFPLIEEDPKRQGLSSGKLSPLWGKLNSFLLSYILRKADLILPISKWMQRDLVSKGIPQERMMPLPLAVNPELFSPAADGQEVSQRYNLGNQKVIIYLGVMTKRRQLEILLYSLAQLKQNKRNVKLLMVGEGNDRSNLEVLARSLGMEEDVIFTGQVPYFEVPQFIAAADIAVSLVPPLDIYKVSSPSKLFEYMGMAKPVVANEEIPEHKEVLEESGGGVLVPFTPEAFAHAIVELLDNPERAAEMGRKGREWVVENRTYEILARKVEQRYFELLTNR